MRTKTRARRPKHLAPKLHANQRYRIDGFPVDESLYAAFQAARPAILLYLKGKGARPHDPAIWFIQQDRKVLRQLHTRKIPRDDPRYFDALIEAANAGDTFSKKETRELAEHARVMGDGFYPTMAKRASELGVETQALGRTVDDLRPKAKVGAKVIGGDRARGQANAKAQATRCVQWNNDLCAHYGDHPLARHVSYRAEADRILNRDVRVMWKNGPPGYELLRKDILPPSSAHCSRTCTPNSSFSL